MVEEITEEEFEKKHVSLRYIPRMNKNDFVKQFKETIVNWVKENEAEILRILRERKYSWHGMSYEDSVKRRNQLESAINESRERNNGGIDLNTADKICLWGFGRKFPLRDEQTVIEITRQAFEHIDKQDYYTGANTLMSILGVGISRASKIIGLSDQYKLCIYDSRVGNALKDLKKDNLKLILCPVDRSYKREFDHTTKKGWATNYERLIWIVEIMQEYFSTKQQPLRAAEIEMALFVMGE